MRAERYNKFVRGKKIAGDEIERSATSRDRMEKPRDDGWESRLSIPYRADEALDAIIKDHNLGEVARIADTGAVSSKPKAPRWTIPTGGGEPPRHRRVGPSAHLGLGRIGPTFGTLAPRRPSRRAYLLVHRGLSR